MTDATGFDYVREEDQASRGEILPSDRNDRLIIVMAISAERALAKRKKPVSQPKFLTSPHFLVLQDLLIGKNFRRLPLKGSSEKIFTPFVSFVRENPDGSEDAIDIKHYFHPADRPRVAKNLWLTAVATGADGNRTDSQSAKLQEWIDLKPGVADLFVRMIGPMPYSSRLHPEFAGQKPRLQIARVHLNLAVRALCGGSGRQNRPPQPATGRQPAAIGPRLA